MSSATEIHIRTKAGQPDLYRIFNYMEKVYVTDELTKKQLTFYLRFERIRSTVVGIALEDADYSERKLQKQLEQATNVRKWKKESELSVDSENSTEENPFDQQYLKDSKALLQAFVDNWERLIQGKAPVL